jgi:hypothetical protein
VMLVTHARAVLSQQPGIEQYGRTSMYRLYSSTHECARVFEV